MSCSVTATGPPHCVAFQSEASNLNSADRDKTSDIFVRDLAHGRTNLVSRGIGAAATNPSIDGQLQDRRLRGRRARLSRARWVAP